MPWPAKTLLTIVYFAAAMAALVWFPNFEQFDVLRWQNVASVFDFNAWVAGAGDTGVGGQLLAPAGSLATFHRALARADAHEPGATVTILHYGDSPIAADQITADARRLLQDRFGDAGAGFVLMAPPWPWYRHRGIEIEAAGWRVEAATSNPAPDHLHGLGGASFTGTVGAFSRWRFDRIEKRVDVSYLTDPNGGAFAVWSNGSLVGEAATTGPRGHSTFPIPPSSREVELRVTRGRVRLFGVTFENDGPGIRYESLGLNGAHTVTPVRYFDAGDWAARIRHEAPDLLVLNYGTNELDVPGYADGTYERDLRRLVRMVQEAAPGVSILIMSPMDRGRRNGRGEVETYQDLPKIVDIQRRVARESGCAFFNTYQAMGGAGTMARWYEARPRLVSADFMHPLPAGAKRVGTLLGQALVQSYLNYHARQDSSTHQPVHERAGNSKVR